MCLLMVPKGAPEKKRKNKKTGTRSKRQGRGNTDPPFAFLLSTFFAERSRTFVRLRQILPSLLSPRYFALRFRVPPEHRTELYSSRLAPL